MLILILFFQKSIGQTIIDYQAWNPSSPPCNLFGSSTNVPATVNGSSNTISHLTNIGQPTYNSTYNSVNLNCSYATSFAVYKGTQYQIATAFQAFYSYVITINAAVINTGNVGSDAYVVLNINSGGNGGNASCSGTQNINSNTSGNLIRGRSLNNGLTFSDYTLNYSALSTAYSFLTVGAVCPSGLDNSQTILIRKITITGTPPTPTFTLSGPTTIPCGTSVTKDFIVTNVYSSPGSLSYDWNLGSSNNGWIYNGSPAPQTFSTSTNTITLTSSSSASSVSSVAATVVLNNSNYTTLNSNTTVTNALPDFNLTNTTYGFDCNSLTVTAPNLPSANFAITWYTNNGLLINGNASPFTTSNGNSVTITSPTNSGGTVYASIGTGACTKISTNQIEFCTCASWGGTTFLYGYLEPLCNEPLIVSITGYQDAVKYQWYINGTFLEETTDPYLFTYNWPNISYGSITVVAVTSCGRTNAVSVADFTPLCSSGYRNASKTINPTIYPNPAANSVTVSLNNNSFSAKEKLDPKNTSGLTQILSIRIIDNTGNIRKTLLFAKGSQQVNFSIAELQKGIYFLELFDGKKRQLLQLIKN